MCDGTMYKNMSAVGCEERKLCPDVILNALNIIRALKSETKAPDMGRRKDRWWRASESGLVDSSETEY